MSLFSKIMGEFKKIALNEKSQLSEAQAIGAMDKLTQLNAQIPQFDRDVAEQLWEHTTKTPEGHALLKDYIQTIIDARTVLKENIDKSTQQLTLEQDIAQRQELEECLLSYHDDYRILGEPLLLQQLPARQSSLQGEFQISQSAHSSKIFAQVPRSGQESTSLRVVLYSLVFLLPCEILCMFLRHHFLNFLTYLAVLSIFSLNYFDRNYIRFCEALLGGSVVLDILWTILHSGNYWNPPQVGQYTQMQSGFMKAIQILTILAIIGKILIMIILFRFTNNTETISKYVRFFVWKIQLTGSSQNSPLSALLAPKAAS